MDDATGSVVDALFCRQEDSHNYFLLMQNLLRRRGIPLTLYTDRHAVFKYTPGSGSTGTSTQFGRAMAELGIQMIFALSPQAKGRVERAAGTFQDRLITELRLAGATTIEQAKAVLKQFLPRYNRRFQVPAQCPDPAFRPLPPDLRLGQVLCFKHKRRVARDNTVQFQRHTLQLLPDRQRRSYACPASTIFAGWRQSVLPVHLLGLAPLLGCVGPVAGDVKLQDDGVVHDPVNRRGGGHGVGKDALPL